MFIRTERLFLRPAWPEDMDELKQVLAEDEEARRLHDAAPGRICAQLQSYIGGGERRLPRFFINLRDEAGAKLIGSVGLARSGGDVELGFWVAFRHRGMGYASEAVRAVLAQARALGHRRVVAAHFIDNAGSAHVLEQSGFRLTDETRPRFSIGRGGEAPARLYVASLADKVFDFIGVGPQAARA